MSLLSAPPSLTRLRKMLKNAPNLLSGYNIYVDTDKLRLIDTAFRTVMPQARSFADLGGVWKVNAGYTRYTLRNHRIDNGYLVDTNFPPGLREELARFPNLSVIHGDFSAPETIARVNKAEVVFFFDVLLHQANPDWKEIVARYAGTARCFVIFNQQYIRSAVTVRLTDLPLEEYTAVAPRRSDDVYQYVYDHAAEMHPQYNKPWKDIHNIFQWGITDNDMRATFSALGFDEVHYRNHGRFSNLPAFENHAFIFLKR